MTTTHNDTETQGALRDVRVVEFGQYIPGPLLGMLLAEQGADVIKVERPGGDPARTEPAFATWNRSKRSVELDLKSADGLAQAQELINWADVLIENFRPGVADRLGIGYGPLAATPASSTAPCLVSGVPGMDEPLFLPLPSASNFAAIIGSVSVAMALIARQRTGRGQRIEVPLHSAMFAAMGRHLSNFHDISPPDLFTLPRNVMSHQYECADGRYVQNHGMYQRFASQFLQAAGRPEWIEDLEDLYGADVSPDTIELWRDRVTNLFREKTAKEWEDAIAETGGACTVCKTVDEWLVHEHAIAGGMVVEVDDAEHGTMKQPGPPTRLRGTPGPAPRRAPTLGEHTQSALAEIRAAPPGQRFDSREEILAALQGVRVLDLCIVLAGPTCGRTLGEFGADVIKIDDPSRPYDYGGNLDVNRGKRSIQIDLKKSEGRDVFRKLLETADVVVENNRKGAMARMGIGYDEVRKRKPDIVYASTNASATTAPGPSAPAGSSSPRPPPAFRSAEAAAMTPPSSCPTP
ncbi:CoA-transferase/lyase DddD [Geodia barretti]|uniref:CoA-transferase/lyase DddD n=1 Tax=Geodia barretti TaxID=519541 RepID=A0AA35XBF4_GEOBA|nr:CoA-transferase/lyase DddD [Geodia barretti]